MGKKLSAYNLYMRKTLKGKLAGKTKAQREAIFKAAARGWNKGKPRSTSRSKPKSGSSKRSSSNTGGRRLGKSVFNTQKIFSLITKGALAAPAVAIALAGGTAEEKVMRGLYAYTGYDYRSGQVNLAHAFETYKPYLFTKVIQAVIPKIGSFIRSVF